METPVHAAWAHGCALEGNPGFWLCLRLDSGQVLAGAAYAPSETVIQLDVWRMGEGDEQTLSQPIPTWIAIDQVAAAWVKE